MREKERVSRRFKPGKRCHWGLVN